MITLQTAFYVLTAFALIGGAGVAWSRHVIHAALFLILALLAVAGLYLVLLADFLALVQVLVYAGAVAILFLFAMMLTHSPDAAQMLDNAQRPWAALVSLAVFLVLAFSAYATPWPGLRTANPTHVDFATIGSSLFLDWAVPFEIASLVLLVAMIGAIIIARTEDRE